MRNQQGQLCPYDSVFVPFYPFLFELSNGKVLFAGTTEMFLLEADKLNQTRTLNVLAEDWDPPINSPGTVDPITGESAVMYDKDKMIKAGGYETDDLMCKIRTNKVYRLDMTSPTPQWVPLDALDHHKGGGAPQSCDPPTPIANGDDDSFYLIALADGRILALGGVAETAPELLDPSSGTPAWVDMAAAPIKRGYHASAVLLADGGVFYGGGRPGGGGGGLHPEMKDGNIFYPPYLYKATNNMLIDNERPQVSSADTLIATGSTFTANVSQGVGSNSVIKASLIKPGAATHSWDQEQRYIPLAFTPSSGLLTLTAPASAEEAPPGHYMLFFVNNKGHPSEAKFVRVWGIATSTIQEQITQFCGSGVSRINFDIPWQSSVATTTPDTLEICPPPGNCASGCPGKIIRTALPDPTDGRKHRVTWQGPCQAGNWCYRIKSSLGGTVSKSAWRTVNVSCPTCPPCNPPCEIE